MTASSDKFEILKLENQVCFPLYACAKEVIRIYRKPLEPLKLTYTQYIVMMVLWEFGDITEKALGQKLYLDSGTLTPLLKKLENIGYITRCRLPDNERLILISLTSAGKKLKEKALQVPKALEGCINLDYEELLTLKSLLNKALQGVDNIG